MQAFLEQVAPDLGLDARFIAVAVDRADGNPQHAEMLRKATGNTRLFYLCATCLRERNFSWMPGTHHDGNHVGFTQWGNE